ncbi:hypothetical protein [Microvirga yunnanensis]|uniref:hypothetical protein n=1 Tax=Microvirga yunnanensis TaxID=2953740 RepID=UPI0021C62334|nr:hypothetical protein [Microvirga sp. HBU65207]
MTEEHLKASGIGFMILRDCLYLDLLPEMFDAATGAVRGPAGEGRVAFVAREDVAQVAARVLTNASHVGATYNVTEPETLSLDEVAQRLSAHTGPPLRYERETLEEGRRWRSRLGAADWEVDTWLGSYVAIARGELEPVSDAVLSISGHPPMALDGYFSEHPGLLDPLRTIAGP